MSNLLANNLKASLPEVLKTSRLSAPFIALADWSSQGIGEMLGQSTIAWILHGLWTVTLKPIQSRVIGWAGLHRALTVIHALSLVGIFLAAVILTTDKIAAVVMVSVLVMLIRVALKPIALKINSVDILVCLFFLTAVLATFFSSYRHTSLIGMAKFSVFFAGYWNFRVWISEGKTRLLWLLGLLAALGCLESLIGFYQYIHHIQPLATWQDTSINPEDQLTRIFGTLKPSNPNLLAGFLIPCMTAGIGVALVGFCQRKTWLGILMALFSAASFLALVLTGSRGGYLAILAMGVILFGLFGHLLWHEESLKHRYKLRALWIFIVLGTIGLAGLALIGVSALRNRFLSIFAMRQDSSNSYRLNVWMSTWRMIKDNWLVGIGPGNNTFKLVYGFYMVPGYNALSAYSIFLEMWAEQGIFGLLSFLLLIKISSVRLFLVFYSQMAISRKLLVGALYCGIIGSIMYGLFDTIWYRPSVNILFWLLIAGLAQTTEPSVPDQL